MPETLSSGVSIRYEVVGNGRPLVLYHGLACTAEDFVDAGYVDELRELRQLILVDGRGHGRSGKPHERAEYAPQRQAEDVVAVLDDLHLAQADFLGYSMGGRIAFALAKYARGRITSYLIGGASPYDLPAEAVRDLWDGLKRGPQGIVDLVEKSGPILPTVKARLLENDVDALKAFFTSGSVVADPLEDVPATMTAPCLLFVGEDDYARPGVEECARQMPNATLVIMPYVDHTQGFFRTDLALPHIKTFLTRLDTGRGE